MAIGMAQVHLPDTPRHVGGRPGDVESLRLAMAVNGIDIVHPNRHPCALVGGWVALGAEGHLDAAIATATLRAQAQEDLALAGANSAERGRAPPVPALLPSK